MKAREATLKLPHRPLGKTGLSVSEIGFGGWGIGKTMWGPTDDHESMAALHAALDSGVDYFDTAYAYGAGHSERLIARLFKEAGRRAAVSTKVPPKNMEWPGRAHAKLSLVFPPDWIRLSVERSMRNLGGQPLDLYQFHVWHDSWLKDPLWPAVAAEMEKLKAEGKVRNWGVSINNDDPESAVELVKTGLVGVVQVLFNMFDQRAADKLLPLCRERGVGVIVRCPFDEGSLTGTLTPETRFAPEDFRSHYFGGERLAETCRRADALARVVIGPKAETLAAAALKYCLSHDAVSTVIPGMRRVSHVTFNARACDGRYFDAAELAAIAKHRWIRDFYL
ncbi:MAG: aldo/keto reductase [Elusimicrobiota bacterium]|nr:MAG: aldo/keto reductase [Elusimicrobiota bacterium]